MVRFDGDLDVQYLYDFRIRNDRYGFLGSDDELIRKLKRLDTGAEYGLRLQQFRKKVDIVRIKKIEDPKWMRREEERRKRGAVMVCDEFEAFKLVH